MGQPLGITEELCFSNSLIEGAVHEEAVFVWKKHLNLSKSDVSTLGWNYWSNFKRWHDNILDSGSGETQASTRKEWITHLNFTKMYNFFNDRIKEARILEALDKPVWMNRDGDIVMSMEENLGMMVTHQVKQPEYMIFVDEVRNNTNIKYDGRVGGKRFLKEKG